MKTEQGKIRTHYLNEMAHLKDISINKEIKKGETISVQFTQYGNKHLYNDSLKHSAVIDKEDLKNLDKALANARFIESKPLYKKRKDDIVMFYYFETEINHKKAFLNVGEEVKTKKNGKKSIRFVLYAITESIK